MKSVLIVISGLILIISAFFVYQFNKPERNIATESPILFSSEDLFQKFSSNEQQANQLYLNKVLQVTGNIVDVTHTNQGEDVIVLKSSDPMFGTSCTLINSGKVSATTKFTIKLADYNIKIPALVAKQLSETVDVSVACNYDPYK